MISFSDPHALAGLDKSEPILLALSGGADSSALLDLLAHHCKKCGATLYAAHVDHLIRKDEHDRDRRFCEALGQKYGIKVFTLKADVPRLAAESGESLELAARKVRYSFFAEIMKENGIRILATAHNADDNFETLIFNITRGTGLRGICGIPAVRELEGGTVVRPILGAKKSEIINYCTENGLSFVTDSTNSDVSYARNRIRLNVMPELRRINADAASSAANLCESVSLDYDFIEQSALALILDDGSLELSSLLSAHPALIRHALTLAFARVSAATLERVHIEALIRLCEAKKNFSSLSLPAGMTARIENGKLRFLPVSDLSKENENYEIKLKAGKNILGRHILLYVGEQNDKNVYKSATRISIDSAKIIGDLRARTRKAGDRILINGMHKDIRKLMNEKKLAPELRACLPLICDESGVLWVPFIGARDGAVARGLCDRIEFEIKQQDKT